MPREKTIHAGERNRVAICGPRTMSVGETAGLIAIGSALSRLCVFMLCRSSLRKRLALTRESLTRGSLTRGSPEPGPTEVERGGPHARLPYTSSRPRGSHERGPTGGGAFVGTRAA